MLWAVSTLLKELDNKEVIISGSVENEESEKDAAERKRKSSAASSDASTTPKTREKVKTSKGNLLKPNQTQVLMNGAINSFDSKKSLDTRNKSTSTAVL